MEVEVGVGVEVGQLPDSRRKRERDAEQIEPLQVGQVLRGEGGGGRRGAGG